MIVEIANNDIIKTSSGSYGLTKKGYVWFEGDDQDLEDYINGML